jgi:hypothetical protein
MMRFRIVGLCLMTAIGISATVSASASAALPEFSGPFPKSVTSKSGIAIIETVGGARASCQAGTNTGEITGPKTGTATLKLTGCVVLSFKCTSPGAAEGEIVSNPLSITLGYINKAKLEVGVSLESATGGPFAEFKCGPVNVTETGSLIGKITPVNKIVKAGKPLKLKFAQRKGKQKPNKFEGGPIDVLMASVDGAPPEEAGVSTKVELTLTEAGEIKA